MLEPKDRKAPSEDDPEEEEVKPKEHHPLRRYGLGIYSWVSLLEGLAGVFIFATICAIVMCGLLYKAGDIADGEASFFAKWARFSLGNLEGAQSLCLNQVKAIPKDTTQHLKCNKGKITQLRHVGIVAPMKKGTNERFLSDQVPDNDYYQTSEFQRQFGYNFCGNSTYLKPEDDCSMMVNDEEYAKLFNEECYEKTECRFKLNNAAIKGAPTGKPECATGLAQIYIQYSCQLDAKETKDNQMLGCVMITFTMIICFVFFETMQWRNDMTALETKNYDMSTCTAADYSVRLNLPQEWYDSFL